MRKVLGGLILSLFLWSCGESDETRMQRFLIQGNDMVVKQNYKEAEDYFKQALTLDSCYAEAWNNLGSMFYNQRKYREALENYTHAITCQKNYSDAYFNRASTYYELHEYYNALQDLDHFKKAKPDTITGFFLQGLIYTRMRKFDEALQSFERAQKLDTANTEILVNLGTIRYYQKHFDAARKDLLQALARKSEPDACNVLAMVETEAMNYTKAMEWIAKALAARPDDAFFLNNRGYLYLMTNDLPKAQEAIDQSIRLDPYNGWSYRNKGLYYLLTDKPEDAIRLFDQAEKMDPFIERIHLYRAQAYAKKGEKSKACLNYKEAFLRNEIPEKEYKGFCK